MEQPRTTTSSPTSPRVVVISYGRRHIGHPDHPTLSLHLADVLHDPAVRPEWRQLTGKDPVVRDHVLAMPGVREMIAAQVQMVLRLLELPTAAGQQITLACSCQGGLHRSVATASAIGLALREHGVDVAVRHWHIDWPVLPARVLPGQLAG